MLSCGSKTTITISSSFPMARRR